MATAVSGIVVAVANRKVSGFRKGSPEQRVAFCVFKEFIFNFIVSMKLSLGRKVLIGFLFILSLPYAYVTLPLWAAMYAWTRTGLSTRTRMILCGGLVVLSLIGFVVVRPKIAEEEPRVAQLTIMSPHDLDSVNTPKVLVKGQVKPDRATVYVNGSVITTNDGAFEQEVDLPDEDNKIVLNAQKDTTEMQSLTLHVTRVFSPEEAAARQKAKDEAEEAAKKAEEAWQKSKAGKICKAHPDWVRYDCDNLANGKIWIGMSYDMVVYLMGKPDSKNVSNYGSGIKYQYCWYDYSSPNCFYDDDNDGLMDSYN